MRRRKEFLQIKREGSLVKGKFLRVQVQIVDGSNPKMGLTVTRHFGKSHERNRFKRLVREVFRLCYPQLPPGLTLCIMPRLYAKEASFTDIQQDFMRLFCSDQKEND